jgi:hypothetical protein
MRLRFIDRLGSYAHLVASILIAWRSDLEALAELRPGSRGSRDGPGGGVGGEAGRKPIRGHLE